MNAQIEMRLITSKYRIYEFIHTASFTAHTDRSPTYYFSGIACGRLLLYATTGVEGQVLTSKRLLFRYYLQ